MVQSALTRNSLCTTSRRHEKLMWPTERHWKQRKKGKGGGGTLEEELCEWVGEWLKRVACYKKSLSMLYSRCQGTYFPLFWLLAFCGMWVKQEAVKDSLHSNRFDPSLFFRMARYIRHHHSDHTLDGLPFLHPLNPLAPLPLLSLSHSLSPYAYHLADCCIWR